MSLGTELLAVSVGLLMACGDDTSAGGSGGSRTGGSGPGSTGGADSTGGSGGSGAASSTGGSGATLLSVVNPGFEDDEVAAGQFDVTITPAGWAQFDPGMIVGEMYNSVGVLNPAGSTLYVGGAPEGSNVAIVFLWQAATDNTPAGLRQDLSHVLSPNTHYTLRVKVGNIAEAEGASYDLNGFPGYRVELLAGDSVLAVDDDTLAPAEGTFEQSSISFTSTDSDPELGLPLTIQLVNLNRPAPGIEVNFDDIELESTPL